MFCFSSAGGNLLAFELNHTGLNDWSHTKGIYLKDYKYIY